MTQRYRVLVTDEIDPEGVAILRALPTRWADALMRRILRIDRKHLVAPPAGEPSRELERGRAA